MDSLVPLGDLSRALVQEKSASQHLASGFRVPLCSCPVSECLHSDFLLKATLEGCRTWQWGHCFPPGRPLGRGTDDNPSSAC